jgi:hypothetical protein
MHDFSKEISVWFLAIVVSINVKDGLTNGPQRQKNDLERF